MRRPPRSIVRQTNLRARVAVLLAASLPVALAVVAACSDNAGPAGVAEVAITPILHDCRPQLYSRPHRLRQGRRR